MVFIKSLIVSLNLLSNLDLARISRWEDETISINLRQSLNNIGKRRAGFALEYEKTFTP